MVQTSRSTWAQACTLASLFLLPSFAAGALPAVSVSNFNSSPSDDANKIKDNFLGISWELSSFNTLWGETPDALPVAMQNYLANIRARMSNQLRIRIGGNSMDSSTYDPSQSVMIKILDDSYYNNVPVSFGPLFFDVINGMSDKIGGMQVISGLSMQDPANDSNVITLAEASRQKLGSKLDALTLGNEPDLYAGHGTRVNYTISDYIPEIGKVLNDFNNSYSDILSSPVIAGPTVCCSWDLADVLNAGLKNYDYKYYTIQHYPTNVCSGQTPATGNLTYYLTHANVAPYISWNNDGMTIAAQQGREVLLTEYNTASCGGDPNVAPTFAATLWAVDVALTAATLNFSAVYLHTREYGITYNLFDPPLSDSSATIPSVNDTLASNWRTGSPYYATLVLAEVISNSSSGSVVTDLNLDNSVNDQSASVAGYGIWDSGKRGKLVLFNFANASSEEDGGAQGSARTFTIPEDYVSSSSSSEIQVRYLLATNTTEQTNISWANQTVLDNGILHGSQHTEKISCKNGCNVTVPGPGLALVLLSESSSEKFYVGNSTVATSGVGDTTDSEPSAESSSGVMQSVWTSGMALVVFSLVMGLVGLS